MSCFRRKFKNSRRAQPTSWQVGNGDGKVKVTVMVKEPSSMQDWGIAELVDEDYDIMQRTSWQGLWKTSLAWSRLNSSPASSSFTPGLPWVKWIDDSSEVFSDYMYIQKLTWAFLLGKVILTTSITSVSVRATWKFYVPFITWVKFKIWYGSPASMFKPLRVKFIVLWVSPAQTRALCLHPQPPTCEKHLGNYQITFPLRLSQYFSSPVYPFVWGIILLGTKKIERESPCNHSFDIYSARYAFF